MLLGSLFKFGPVSHACLRGGAVRASVRVLCGRVHAYMRSCVVVCECGGGELVARGASDEACVQTWACLVIQLDATRHTADTCSARSLSV